MTFAGCDVWGEGGESKGREWGDSPSWKNCFLLLSRLAAQLRRSPGLSGSPSPRIGGRSKIARVASPGAPAPPARNHMSKPPTSRHTAVLLRLEEILEVTTLSAATLYQLIHQGQFPAPRQLSKGRVGWLHREVIEWAERLPVSTILPPVNAGAGRRRKAAGDEPGPVGVDDGQAGRL